MFAAKFGQILQIEMNDHTSILVNEATVTLFLGFLTLMRSCEIILTLGKWSFMISAFQIAGAV